MYVRTHTYDTSATKKQRKKERKSDKNNNIWRNKSNKRKMKKKRERVRDVLPRSWQCRPKEKKEKSEKLPTKSLTFVSQEPPPWTLPPPPLGFHFHLYYFLFLLLETETKLYTIHAYEPIRETREGRIVAFQDEQRGGEATEAKMKKKKN